MSSFRFLHLGEVNSIGAGWLLSTHKQLSKLLQPIEQRFDIAVLGQGVLVGAPKPRFTVQHRLDDVVRTVFQHGVPEGRIVRSLQSKAHNVGLGLCEQLPLRPLRNRTSRCVCPVHQSVHQALP